jgi:cytochrome c oxidase assembly protein subunit 15
MPAAVPRTAGPDSSYPPFRRWLQGLAWALVAATFVLVAIGGHVTSKDAGMAVPDGFTTFGVWSLIAPLETWWYDEGTRLEHTHRLKGYVVGLLTLALTVALFATQGPRRWLKVWGVILLLFVIGQALLGIFRVDEVSVFLAGIHGVTGQIFFGATVLAAVAVGRFWMTRPAPVYADRHRPALRKAPLLLLGLLLLQLVLGSAVRHSGSALAIPDWPLHYGQLVPPMSPDQLNAAVTQFPADQLPPRYGVPAEGLEARPYQVSQVHLHFTHRLGAYLTAAFGVYLVARTWRRHPNRPAALIPATLLGVLLLLQVALGVMTVWSGEHATLATSHQTVGALLLATAVWLTARLHLIPRPDDRPAHVPVAAGDATTEKFHDDPSAPPPRPSPA